jgi:hypothetical protein
VHRASAFAHLWLVVAGLLISICSVRAESPTLDYIFPAGAERGSTNKVTIGGKFDPWPPKVWADSPGFQFEPGTNKGVFHVLVSSNALPGPHLVRIFNDDGASAPKCFVIGTEPEISEVETNDTWKQAQQIETLPALINGRLEKSGDVDCFAVTLEGGKWLVASVDAYALGSPIDPHLALLDDRGIRVAFNSDRPQSFDPFLAWKVEKAGTYILQLAGFVQPAAAEIRLAGSAASIYRLDIRQTPVATSIFPLSIERGALTNLDLTGPNIDENSSNSAWSPHPPEDQNISIVAMPQSQARLKVALTDLPVGEEHEPNNRIADAQELKWPMTINGRIDPAGDEDRFRFTARKNEKIEFRLRSAALGLPLDAFLRIEDENGKQVARDDDAGDASDPLLNWNFQSNATYILVVGDLYRRGGLEYAYSLDVQTARPDFKASVDTSALRLESGKTNELALTINRFGGHTNQLTVTCIGLPDGIACDPVEVGPKDKERKLKLHADADAKPTNGIFQVLVSDSIMTNLQHHASFDIGPKENRFGDLLISSTDQLWLTISTNAPPAEKPKSK